VDKTRASHALAAEALGVTVDSLPGDAAIGSLEAWDSLGHMRLLLAIEARLGRELTMEEATSLTALADVERLLG
jgi:acyl carrier protein